VSVPRLLKGLLPTLAAMLTFAPAALALPLGPGIATVHTVAPGCTTDCTEPTDLTSVPAATGDDGWHTAAPLVVLLDGTDDQPGVTIHYNLDGTSAGSAPAPTNLPLSGDGTYTLNHWARDAAGNTSAPVAEPIKIDTVDPVDGTVVPAPSSGSATVRVQGSDATSGVAKVAWRLDLGGIQEALGTSADVVVTGDGNRRIDTQITDRAGHVSGWRTQYVRVDSVAPVDDTAVSAAWAKGPTVPVSIHGSDEAGGSGVASVHWILDGVQSSTTAASHMLTVSGAGEHDLRTWVVDGAGNVSTPTDHIVRIDLTPPSNLTPMVSSAWRSTSAAVRLDGADAGGSGLRWIEWKLDTNVSKTDPAGTVVTVSGTGQHTLMTRALDAAGHASAWQTNEINIDMVAPVDNTDAPPATPQPSPYTLVVDGHDVHSSVDHVEWKVDGAATAQTGPSGSNVLLTGDGTHTFQTRIVDAAGNDSGWRTQTVTIDSALPGGDTTPPVDTTTPPAGWRTGDVTVKLTGTDAGVGLDRMEVRGLGPVVQTLSPGGTVTITGDGTHRFETRGIDGNDRRSTWRAHIVRIDTTPPVDGTTISSTWTNEGGFGLAGSDPAPGSGIENIEWEVEGGAAGAGPAGTSVPLSDGVHLIRHRAVDRAGQASPWVESTLSIDTVAPIDDTPPAPAGWQTTPWITAPSGTDADSGIARKEWRIGLDGDVRTDTVAFAADGAQTVYTRVIDAAGNDSGWRSHAVQIDQLAPTDTTPAAPGGWRRTPWSVTADATDGPGSGVASTQWRVGETGTPSTTFPAVISAQGETTFYTSATDVAGNESPWREHVVRIDGVAPDVALDCGDGTIWRTVAVTCTTAADGGDSGLATLTFTRGGDTHAVAAGAPVTVAADGRWDMALDAVDGAGNGAQAVATVNVDRTPPAPALSCAAAPEPLGWDCTASATDTTSGVRALRWRVDGGAWQTPAAGGSFRVDHGSVEVQATDVAGLAAVSAPARLADRTPPAVTPAKVRTRSVPVTLRGRRGDAGLIGAFELRTQAADGGRTAGSADVRPLLLAAGRYRVSIRISSGQLTARRVRTITFRRKGGNTPRIGVALAGLKGPMLARLVVERRSGRRWKAIATASASLKP
jgi:hypothetical protein